MWLFILYLTDALQRLREYEKLYGDNRVLQLCLLIASHRRMYKQQYKAACDAIDTIVT